MKDKTIVKDCCPFCGGTSLSKTKGGFVCKMCGSIFNKPKTSRITVPKKPRYIG